MPRKIGVIGATGYIATPYREEIRQAPEEAQIVALCARRRDLLEAAGREDGATLLTDDWRAVVDHPEVDTVLVATPDALHHEAVMASAAAGKHLVCEKPLGADLREAFEMCAAYRNTRLGHFVPFWSRYVPVIARAREVVQSGRLGQVQAMVYRWHNPRPANMPFTWRDDAELSSAGSIADVGSHAYDTMRWMLGSDATRVLAHADVITPAKPDLGAINLEEALQWGGSHQGSEASQTRKGTAYDYASIAFELESGAVGTLILSHAPFVRKALAPDLELHGEEASLAVDRTNNRLTLAEGEEPPQILEEVPNPGWGNRFAQYVFPALKKTIDGEPSDHPSLEDGYQVQKFTDAAARSARDGGWVDLRELASEFE